MTDLIVIGAGLTGMIAAYTAAKAGLTVKLVAKGLGALHWNAGTMDVLGYCPDEQSPVARPLDAIAQLTNHPYTLAGHVADALKNFSALTNDLGLPFGGAKNSGENFWLASPVGAARPTFLAPRAQIGGDLARTEPMLIVGLRGMRDFYPELIAENLRKQGHAARAAFLPLDLITARHDINPVQIARALDNPGLQTVLAIELKNLVRPGERIGLPAILGMNNHADALERLQAHLGATVFEIPTLPPSVPGVRLNNALRRALEQLGVRVDVNMDVEHAHIENKRVVWIESESASRPLKHRAEKFLLATGGILGGGITNDHTGVSREVIFDLPLNIPTARGAWFRARLFDPAGHPVFRGGVMVNRDFQPVDANGARVYDNVWAAGGVLANADSIAERSLEGVALATGIAAARRICNL